MKECFAAQLRAEWEVSKRSIAYSTSEINVADRLRKAHGKEEKRKKSRQTLEDCLHQVGMGTGP